MAKQEIQTTQCRTESPGIENIYKKSFFQLRPNWQGQLKLVNG